MIPAEATTTIVNSATPTIIPAIIIMAGPVVTKLQKDVIATNLHTCIIKL